MKNYSRPIVALCVLFVLKLIKIAFLIYSTSKAWKTILRLVWFLKLLKIAKNSCLQHISRGKNNSRHLWLFEICLLLKTYQNSLFDREFLFAELCRNLITSKFHFLSTLRTLSDPIKNFASFLPKWHKLSPPIIIFYFY